MKSGEIFNIQRFCLHDGPGIRSVVFFKGCPLHCLWCSNPESQSPKPQLMYNRIKCLGCRECAVACKTGAISVSNGKIAIDRGACIMCGDCAAACPEGSMSVVGYTADADSVFQSLLRDRDYYAMSGGGVTFSGGEATAQSGFLLELAEKLKREHINLALETCGMCDQTTFRLVAEAMDRILFDIKILDFEKFRQYTGGDLGAILKNLKIAAELSELIIRVPLIPSVNMNDEFYRSLGKLCDKIRPSAVQLLPYHRLGESKYRNLDVSFWNMAPARVEENKLAEEQLAHLCNCKVELLS